MRKPTFHFSGPPHVWLHIAAWLTLFLGPAAVLAGAAQVLQNSPPKELAKASPAGRLPATTQMNLAIALPLRNQNALTNFLHELYDPKSAQYHHFLKPSQFTQEFGPSVKDYQTVIAFAKAHHLKVIHTHPNRTILDLSGSVLDVENMFNVLMETYQHPKENRTFYAPNVAPSVQLSVPLLGVSGLDDYSRPQPLLKATRLSKSSNVSPNSGAGPSGTYMGSDFRAAYVPDSALNGAGQVVGLLQFDGYTASDIIYYEQKAGLPSVPLQNVLLDGFSGSPTGNGGEVEVSLDIEMAISMAPGLSKIIVYEAGPSGNWHDILNRMATDNQAKQLSCSWYSPGMGADPVADQIFQQMAAQGQSFMNASGDYDAYTGLIPFPGDTPYITQVGGTTLTTSGPNGPRVSETVWNRGNGVGSGGGVSTSYSSPDYQKGVNMSGNQGSTTMRNTPDVGLTAENVYVRADGYDYQVGGTSCSAPLWAGFMALVNQKAVSAGKPTLGFINPAVYTLGKSARYTTAFNDITTGNNTSSSSPTKFFAVSGYDLCTGWGTPKGYGLITALAIPDPLQIVPGTGFTATGVAGGPFDVTSQQYALTNVGTASLNWTLANTSAWLSASSSSGTLSPGGPASLVTISLNSAASNLVAGIYESTIWFTNLSDGVGQNLQFTLNVLVAPSITSAPTNVAVIQGAPASFYVQASGSAPLSYRWRFNGTNLNDGGNIAGSATTKLTVSSVSPSDVGGYSVVVTNIVGAATSSAAELSITPSPPVIVTQPASQTVAIGAPASFSVGLEGTPSFTYHWSHAHTNLSWGTNAVLTLTNVQPVEGGIYSVVVSNSLGYATSSNAVLNPVPVPLIFSFSPLAAASGTTVTINGTGFDSASSNDVVYFGPVKAAVLSASTNTLKVTVPSGATYAPITVTVNGLVAYANAAFEPTFLGDGSAITTSSFAPALTMPTSNGPVKVIFADFDGDGKPDMAVVNDYGHAISIYQNVGTNGSLGPGSFVLAAVFPFGSGSDDPWYMTAADVDGDGKLDLVVPDRNAAQVLIYRNLSTGGPLSSNSFAVPVSFPVGPDPRRVVVRDLDGDGRADIIVPSSQGNSVSILRNIGSAGLLTTNSFAPEFDLPVGVNPEDVAVGDLDGDGKPDLAVANSGGTIASVYRNISTIGNLDTNSFAPRVDLPAPSYGITIAIGDVDGDGKSDLILGSYTTTTLSVYRNVATPGSLSTNSFAPRVDFDPGGEVHTVALADVNGDGKPDIVLVTESPSHMSIFQNLSTPGSFTSGSLGPRVDFASGNNAWGVAVGDLNGDGRPDIVFANTYDNDLTIYQNQVGFGTAPVITSQPANTAAVVGQTAVFSVTAKGALPLSYQWNSNSTNILVGQTNAILVLSHVQSSDAGTYAVVVTNTLGSVLSSNATLTVVPPPTNLPPAITSVSPVLGSIGTVVTIQGRGFDPVTSNDIVYFGAVQAIIVSATPSTLVVRVPAGATYAPLTVTVGGLIAYASAVFEPIFTGTGTNVDSTSFAPAVTFGTTNGPVKVLIADLDGDGKPDMIVVNDYAYTISVYQNIGTNGPLGASSFALALTFPIGSGSDDPWYMTAADVDGDGKIDLIVPDRSANQIAIYRNLSTPGALAFDTPVRVDVGADPKSVAIRDLDGDGRPDIVTANNIDGTLSILQNLGIAGTLTSNSFARIDLPTTANPESVAIADIDGDGKADLAVTCAGSLSIYQNLSVIGLLTTNSFGPRIDLPAPGGGQNLAIGDLDGDGRADLVFVSYLSQTLSVYQNVSTPGTLSSNSFAQRVDFDAGGRGHTVALGDFNGDGKPDIALVTEIPSHLSIFQNLSTPGTFGAASLGTRVDYPSGNNAWGVAVGDLNGDGRPDIAFANAYDNSLTLYQNVMAFGIPPGTNPPVITSFSPLAAAYGATVTINGTGFDPISANDIVYFGAVRATVLSAAANTLQVSVPSGATYSPITVTVNGLVAYAKAAFEPTFLGDGLAISTSSFAPGVTMPTSNGPVKVVFADFNGDGKPDMAVVNDYGYAISIYQNIGTNGSLGPNSFELAAVFPFGSGSDDPLYMTVADVDGDGKPDLVVPDRNAAQVVVYRNLSTGGPLNSNSFAAPVSFPVGNDPRQVVVRDLDGDGHPDIVVANYADNTISLLHNTGFAGAVTSNSFAPKIDLTVGPNPIAVVALDIDGDGKPDLAVANSGGNFISLLQNLTTPGVLNTNSFSVPISVPSPQNGLSLISGDLDGDGKQDLVLIGYLSETMSVYRNISSSGVLSSNSFAPEVDFNVGGWGHSLALADFNGDGKPDLALVTEQPSHMSIYQNLSTPGSFTTGSLGSRIDFASGNNAWGIAAGDLDGDGRPDIVFANAYDNDLTIYHNVQPFGVPRVTNPPVIISFNPVSSSEGGPVMMIGTGFGPFASNNIVYFGAVRATVVSASSTNLQVIVPAGATYAPISVTVSGLTGYANAPFEPTFIGDGSPISASSFAPVAILPTSNGPVKVVFADFNNDGKPDMAVVNDYGHAISIYQNLGTNGSLGAGSFALAAVLSFGSGSDNPWYMTVADVDGDGYMDLVVPDRNANRIVVYRNLASGTTLTSNSFAPPVAFAVGANPRRVVVQDLDGDGRPDIVVPSYQNNTVCILRNVGYPGFIAFAPEVELPVGPNPEDVAVGDLDGDGLPDLVVANTGGTLLSLYRNISAPGSLGTNSFASRVDLPAPSYGQTVAIGDLDGDGKSDLVLGSYLSQTLSVYQNLSTPGTLSTNSFAPRIDFAAGARVHNVALSDINGDGKPDILLISEIPSQLSVFQNLSTPGTLTNSSFGPRVDFTAGANNAWGLAAGDLDGDGRPDVIFANAYGNNLSIYKNIAPFGAPPSIVSQPASVLAMPGCSANFSVVAAGVGPLAFQWLKDMKPLAGQTNSSLNLSNIQSSDFAVYSVVVTHAGVSATSSNAVLALDHLPVPGTNTVHRYSWGGLKTKTSDLLITASDADGDPLSVVGVSPFSAAGGIVGLTNNWIYYLPPPGFTNADSYTFTMSDSHCGGLAVGTMNVQVRTDYSAGGFGSIANPSPGSFSLSFVGAPGTTYRIQFTEDLASGVWQDLGSSTADIFGGYGISDNPPANSRTRFYRSVTP